MKRVISQSIPGLLATLALAACGRSDAPSAPALKVAVAPLSLAGVTNACYRLTVTNGPDRTGDIVWQQDNVCADDYGDGLGSITYIGTCDAGVTADNSVTLELIDLMSSPATPIDKATYISPCGRIADWQGDRTALMGGEDPHGPCTVNKACVENADVLVAFDLTVMRDAQQGFFDVAVEFDDIFCSAKVDCRDRLLTNTVGERDTTAVVAFACTAGENEETYLHVSDLFVTCDDDGNPSTAAPWVFQLANDGSLGQHGAVTVGDTTGIFDWAIYRGDEQLTSNGAPLEKCYWNRSVGLDLESLQAAGASSCTLTALATATDTIDGLGIVGAAGVSYPVIRYDVVLFTAGDAGQAPSICSPNPLNGDGSGVTTQYVSSSTAPTTLLPMTGHFACGSNVLQCAGGPLVNTQRDAVIATQNDANTITVSTGGQTAVVPLTGALAGFTLGAGCQQDPCCSTP